MKRKHAYYATLEPGENGAFWVYFHDFDGQTSFGESETEAAENAKTPLSEALLRLFERGETPPEPTAPEAIPLAPGEKLVKIEIDLHDFFPEVFPKRGGARVGAGRPRKEDGERGGRPHTLNVRLSDDELRALETLAERAKLSKSQYLRSLFLDRFFEEVE